jgi:UPF0716 family protein affecting phage T7 exclusion
MLKRLLGILCVLVAVNVALLIPASRSFDWRLLLAENIVMAAIGLSVIVAYQSRWSSAIAVRLDDEGFDAASGQHHREDALLLVAGLLFVIPGLVLNGVAGMLLLAPWTRKQLARSLWRVDY